jgi:hypothetical protein
MNKLQQYKQLSQESYKDFGKRNKQVGDWRQIGGSRHIGLYQNQNSGEIHQSISGSRSISDYISDAFLALGIRNQHYYNRKDEAEEMAKRVQTLTNGANKLTISGHSLGGNLTNELIEKGLGDSGTTFNSYITHHDYKPAQNPKITNVRNHGDFASILTRNNPNTININRSDNKYYDISNHSLRNIEL